VPGVRASLNPFFAHGLHSHHRKLSERAYRAPIAD
jgi:hypothetical protein